MQRIQTRLTTAVLLSLAASAAMAQGAPVADPAPVAAPADAAAVAADERTDDRHCLRATGSRIVERANARGERRCTVASGRVYSRDDLDRAGMGGDLAETLRRLDTSIR
ncbi:hypothetical protein [Cognatilysobacter tabacisoli]|uniref:hypothetical protein n=1 Tax=Cognatilysobacter tabacisoli TaxID=2315424 RepID=UPI000E6B09F5|nr:hypothetical protein [Lysobacter tabacisoli]